MSHTSSRTAIDGGRTIHVYSAFTQNILKVGIKQCKVYDVKTASAFGAIRKRRREEAICIQLHNRFHCSFNNWSCLTRCFDMKNAFYCPTIVSVTEQFDHCPEPYHSYFEDTLGNCIAIVSCQDRTMLVRTRTGVPPGLVCATKVFNNTTNPYKSITRALSPPHSC